MNKVIKWLNNQKDEDTILTSFLELGYAIGQKSWIHSIISASSGILIPITIEDKNCVWSIIFSIIMLLDIFYAHICNEYKNNMYILRKFSSEVLSDQSSLIKSIAIEMENNANWKKTIFKTVSGLVCEKIYRNFKDIYKCETRVSIEYVFNKTINRNSNTVQHVKMSARRSNHRATVKKSIPLSGRSQYYSYKIFTKNNKGINILTEEQIKDTNVWYKNPESSVDVKKYLGIAVSIDDKDTVKFILQIDCLDDITFGENNTDEEVKEFIERYLMTYINIVSLSYLLNMNKKKGIPEV